MIRAATVLAGGIALATVAWAFVPLAPHVSGAKFVQKTDRYGHDVLGGNEYAAMQVSWFPGLTDMGRSSHIQLPEDRVFEDIEPRIADMTGDRFEEVIVVESSLDGGAELAVYGIELKDPGKPQKYVMGLWTKLASTPPIGRRNRWLAPAGIADFNGDGQNDIAYVETPHIGGTLRVWTMQDGALVQIAEQGGFSNHRIGEDFITGGARDCGEGVELVLPEFGWSRLLAVKLEGGSLSHRTISEHTDPTTVSAALNCELK